MWSMKSIRYIAIVVPVCLCTPISNIVARGVTTSNAETVYTRLQQWYDQSTGLWQDQWWNSGSCIATIAALATINGNVKDDVVNVIANSYTQAPKTHPGFVDDYYDDDGWWALALISAYDLTSTLTYLSTAETILTEMLTTFGQTSCSNKSQAQGGIWWDKAHTYVNAIPNELLFSVAAHLANRVQNGKQRQYRDVATKQWEWFKASGMINQGNTINDGLDSSSCGNNGGVVWTYNQGVVLGALVELSTATGDSSYLWTARTIASTAIAQLSDSDGILHEPCESYAEGCDSDRTQFKGIFVRNLAKLVKAVGGGEFGDFLKRNAESAWGKASDGKGVIGVNWKGPFGGGNASTTCSGLDVLVAALGL